MDAIETLNAAVTHARKIKTDHVRTVKGDPDRTDIPTAVECFRGGDPVAVTLHLPHRDVMLGVAELLIRGMGADSLAITCESFGATQPTNPDTGEDWGHGEMAVYFAKHGAGHAVHESLMTTVVTRAGDAYGETQPYLIENRTLHWLDDRRATERGLAMGGFIVETLQKLMERPTLMQHMLRTMGAHHLDPDVALAINDYVVVSQMPTSLGPEAARIMLGTMMFALPGTPRHQALRERLGRGDIADPRKWSRCPN